LQFWVGHLQYGETLNAIKLSKIQSLLPSLSPAIERVDERSKVRVSQRSAFITAIQALHLVALKRQPQAETIL